MSRPLGPKVIYPEMTLSAHMRSASLTSAPVGALTIYTLPIFTHLQAFESGTPLAILNVDLEALDDSTSTTLCWKGTDSLLSHTSESIEKSGIMTVDANGAMAFLHGRIDIDSSPA